MLDILRGNPLMTWPDSIQKTDEKPPAQADLQDAIGRIRSSQAMMHAVNGAVSLGDHSIFRKYRFSSGLIDQLLKRHARGLPAYPDFLFRHNVEILEALSFKLFEESSGIFAAEG